MRLLSEVFMQLWEHSALFTFPTVLPVPSVAAVSSLDCHAEAAAPLSSLPFRLSLSPALEKKKQQRSLLCPNFLSTSMSRASAACLVCVELQVPMRMASENRR